MSRRRRIYVFVPLAAAATVAAYALLRPAATVPEEFDEVGRLPAIDPDYCGCTIPPNIAPLNFVVKEPGVAYRVRFCGEQGEGLVVSSRRSSIVIPPKQWAQLLECNRGSDLRFDVYVQGAEGRWRRFDTVVNRVAREPIDPYLVYRRIRPVHNVFTRMGIYQRELGTYRESPLVLSDPASRRCINCHTFTNHDPDPMCLHVRGGKDGSAMLLAKDGSVAKLDTRTQTNRLPASYTAWHPSGRLAAFSSIEIVQFHHAVGNSRDVFVHASDLGLYWADSHSIAEIPPIADADRLETFPAWSPDGKYLYFCSAPRSWEKGLKGKKMLPMNYRQARYDLMRIPYDLDTGTWGTVELLLSSQQTGLSINEPRISPDGRLLLFCMSDRGSFPVFRESSDLYLMDLRTMRHWPLEINSPRSDSWHCWASNGRWIAYASKRRDGLFGRVYFSYVDPNGQAHKPVLLPQEDPTFYDSFLDNFNVPELIARPVGVEPEEFLRALESSPPRETAFVAAPSAAEAVSVGQTIGRPPAQKLHRIAETDVKKAGDYYRLGLALEKQGRIDEAIDYYRWSVERLPELHQANIPVSNRLAWIHATHPSDRIRDGRQAMLLAGNALHNAAVLAAQARAQQLRKRASTDFPMLLNTLAAACAECGEFQRAAETALEAETLALRQGQIEWAFVIRDIIDCYLVHQPYRTAGSQ